MKNILALLLLLVSTCFIAQEQKTVSVDSKEYVVLKESGDLDGYHIKYLTPASTKVEKYVGQPATTRAGGGGTSDPCNPWIQPNDFDDPNYPLEDGELYSVVGNYGDDSSNGPYSLPFNFCFYGTTYTSVYINNNGNLSFGAAYGTYTPEGFPSANYVMIAPFWGDVNMAAEGGDCVYAITETAMYVNWLEVGYFGSNDDLKDTFQVIITNGSDPVVPGGNNVSFTYQDMQWTTGTASGGVGGFGGSPAQVGANKGDGSSYILFGQFDADDDSYDGPFGDNDGVDYLDYKYFVFNTCTDSENVAPIYEGGACTDLVVCQGGAITLDFLAPEEDQTISVDFIASDPNITVSAISDDDGTASVIIGVTDEIAPGFYEVTIIATDDFEADPGVTEIFYTLEVVEDDLPPVVISGPDGICPGQLATLTLEGADTYGSNQWSTGSFADQIFVSSPGLYSVTASTEICLKYGEFEVLAFPDPTPVFDPEEAFVCEGGTTTISLTESYETIVWNFNPSLNTQSIDLGEGTQIVSVTTAEGCTGGGEITIVAYPTTEVNGGQVCGDSFDASGTVEIPGDWAISGPGSVVSNSNPNSPNTTIAVSECGTYNMIYTDECGLTQNIDVVYLNDEGFGIEPLELCIGDQVTIVPIGCGGDSFDWTWDDDSHESTLTLIADGDMVDSDGFGSIGYSATNDCGTYSGEAVLLILPCEVETFNVFTPNSDESPENGTMNDYFLFRGVRHFVKAELIVFNRWGGVLYENNDYNVCDVDNAGPFDDCWTPTEDEAPEGTYYYILNVTTVTGEKESVTGYVQILR